MKRTLEGKDLDEIAIERIQAFEPPEGYYLAFSGGKDSITVYDLALRAGVKFDTHYNLTTADPPELVQFIRQQYPQVDVIRPPKSLWVLCAEPAQGKLPTRVFRWCCELLKEVGGQGHVVLTGLRWAESSRRARRKLAERARRDPTKTFVNAIIDWTDIDVWQYIGERDLSYCSLYDEGFHRLGCVLCPMVGGWQLTRQIDRWPKIVQAWHNAAQRCFDYRLKAGLPQLWPSGDAYFEWWLSRKPLTVADNTQTSLDDCLVPFSD